MTGLPMAILAGGLGTRLGPLCRDRPKALVEVAGRPFIHHQLDLLAKNGFTRGVILAGFLGDMIAQSVGDGSAFGLRVAYSFDWPDLLGTGGAILKALPLLGDRFMVVYGDSYLGLDYQAVGRAFLDSGQPALMTVFRNDGRYDRSNVLYADGAIRLYDKKDPDPMMRHIDYGLGCMSSSVFDGLSGNFDLADVYSRLSRQGRLAGFLVAERFHEIGSPSGLAGLEALLGGHGGKE
ncbi:MAG: NTP transferase domain-containing protein [Deltaproteobacteria bacterium]|nr:NTP transferase domain-containing protein [Deltaproteobacteria bacterium]